MSDSLVVVLGSQVAGTVVRLRGGQLRFDYDDDYRTGRSPIPLSLSMPVQVRTHTDRVVRPWLWGLLPENEAVLDRWAREFQASASSPLSLLGTPVGEDCAGAVRLVRPERLEQHLERAGDVVWLTEAEVAQRLRELAVDTTAWLGRPVTGQFSLAGMQAKTALRYSGGSWGIPSGAEPTSHILKPAVARLADHDLNEHLCMEAARRTGLVVATTRIERFEDQSAIVVERYDRVEQDGAYVRVHQEDLCQALSVLPSGKYQNNGGPGPEDIVALMRRAMPSAAADEDTWRFIDALALNWFIAGTDGHAKNYSLLLGTGEVRLAPLYDIASALPYDDHERRFKLAMKLGGSYAVYPFRNPWRRVANDLAVDVETLLDRVVNMGAQLPDAFADASAHHDALSLGSELPMKLVNRVADRTRRCLDVIASDR
jgi:serine/threonine-protein kinase HipA